jgi:hypothetical protein
VRRLGAILRMSQEYVAHLKAAPQPVVAPKPKPEKVRKARKVRAPKHGCYGTSEYRAYHNMLSRCLNPKHPRYRQYGARGVQICQRWLESFQNFLADMGLKPEPELTLDRIDPSGNYEPANCRWISFDANRRNRRSVRFKESAAVK